MTALSKPVRRLTAATNQRRQIVITVAPLGSNSEALVGVRRKGCRSGYVARLTDLFNWMAEQHGYKLKRAKREARQQGVKWAVAKKRFNAANKL